MIISPRQSLTRKLFAIGVLLAVGLNGAKAQDRAETSDPDVPATDGGVIETIAAIVHGLSANDLLNVRATASPIGLVLARIPNGTVLTRLECATSRNTRWCRVEVPDLGGLVGWTPERYLHFARAEDEPADESPAPLPNPQVIDPSQITVGILPDPLPMPDDPLADPAPGAIAGNSDLQTVLLAPGADPVRDAQKIDGAATDLALAYATRTDAALPEVYSAFGIEGVSDSDGETGVADTSVAPGVPLPSPRPPREAELEPPPAPQLTVAAAPSSDAATLDRPIPAPAPIAQVAPVAAEQGAPIARDVTEPEPPGAEKAADASPEPSAVPRAETPVSPEPSVAMALADDGPDNLAPPSAVVSEPSGVEASEPSLTVPSPEPVESQDVTDGSEQTLREQLAALLPSWSRPAVPAPAEPDDAGPTESLEGAADASAIPEDAALTAETPSLPAADEVPSPPPAASLPDELPQPAVEDNRPIETIAQAGPSEPATPVSAIAAEIPCARYVGQPTTRCEVRVMRIAADDADVTVLWPDGGERLIRFRGGQPDSTNGRGEFRFTREAELNLIRIGSGERFEILDALPFAD